MWVEWPRGRVAALQVPPTCTKYNPLFLFYVTDMAAVSLFWCPSVFFWRSYCVLVIEHQKEKITSPPASDRPADFPEYIL
jgi:hypothetical protein